MLALPKKHLEMPVRLRAVIGKTGLSQAKFAALVGADLFRLKNVLSGTMSAPLDLIDKIVKHTGANATWLVTGYAVEPGELTDTEKVLLANFRGLHVIEQGVMVRAIEGLNRGRVQRDAVPKSRQVNDLK